MIRSREVDIEGLVAANRAARIAGESVSRWWKQLASAAESTMTSESLDDLFREAMVTVRHALDADSVAMLLANESGDELVARFASGLNEEVSAGICIRSGQGMAGRVLATRQPLIVDDLSQIELAYPLVWDSGIRSVVAVPILSDSQLLGVMHVGSHQPASFSPLDAELLEMLAEKLGLAASRVQLFEEQLRLATMCSFLADASKVVAEGADLRDALDRLAGLALTVLGDVCLIDGLDQNQVQRRLVAKHRDPVCQELLDRLSEFPPDPHGNHPAVAVMRTGKPIWSPTMSKEFLEATTHNAEHLAITLDLGFCSFMAVPLANKGDMLGSLTFVSCTTPFREKDVELAERLAHQVEALLANTWRNDVTLETSHVIQASLLPSILPSVEGVRIHTRYEAASAGLDIGGDFYDVLALPDDKVMFMIGDVAGHDRGAAALMGQLRSAARALAGQASSPNDLIVALQSSWEYLGFERIATALFGELDPPTGHLILASAGHYPPILIDGSSATLLPIVSGPPLGVVDGAWTPWRGNLEPNQTLLLYTDGAVDERHLDFDQALERLMTAASAGEPDPKAACDRIIDLLGNVRYDDVALLAIQLESLPIRAHPANDRTPG